MFELNIIHKDWEAKTVFIRGDFLVFEVELLKKQQIALNVVNQPMRFIVDIPVPLMIYLF